MDIHAALWLLAMQSIRFNTWKDLTGKTDISEFYQNPFEAETLKNVLPVIEESALKTINAQLA